MTRPVSVLFSVALALGLLPAERASAQSAPQEYRACYVPLTGTVYRIGEPGLRPECASPSHVEFSWTSGGSGDHGDLAGLGDDDHPQYLLADGSRGLTDGVAFTGTRGTGSPPFDGDGVAMMWYPGKAAVRAGWTESSSYWSDANSGVASTAFGRSTMADGDHSVAMGYLSRASGESAVALGAGSTASGLEATALGRSTASGAGATAMGRQTLASGEFATAAGYQAKATGRASLAVGYFAEASGDASVALGRATAAPGPYALAQGFESAAEGAFSVAMGRRSVADASYSTALGNDARTNGMEGSFVYGDRSFTTVSASRENQFVVRAQHFWLGQDSNVTDPAGHFLTTSTGAHLTTGGTWTNASDEGLKEAFADVDADAVLAKVAGLPVREWTYRAEDDAIRHLGPTAQDFHRAFGLGGSAEAIATVDADGVSLLAIQALERRTRDQAGEVERLRAENAELRRTLHDLRSRVDRLETGRRR